MNKFIQKAFGLDPKVTTIKTEILAGITTFLTMSWQSIQAYFPHFRKCLPVLSSLQLPLLPSSVLS